MLIDITHRTKIYLTDNSNPTLHCSSNPTFLVADSVLSSAGVNSGLGLSSIKLESPAYYCTSYASPPGDQGPVPGTTHAQLVTANYGTLSLAPARTSPSSVVSLGDNNLIRVKRMRRMSSETEEDLRGDKSQVSDLQYYTGSPLSGTATWTQSDIDQATAIGETYAIVVLTCFCT